MSAINANGFASSRPFSAWFQPFSRLSVLPGERAGLTATAASSKPSDRAAFFAVPTIAVLLLLVITLVRLGSHMDNATRISERMDAEVRRDSIITALRLQSVADLPEADLAEAFERALPLRATSNGSGALLLSAEGTVIAQYGLDAPFTGVNMLRLTGARYTFATIPRDTALPPFDLDGRLAVRGFVRSLDLSGRSIMLVRPLEQAFAGWWRDVKLDLVLFSALLFVMIVTLAVYLREGIRVRHGSAVHERTRSRFDSALMRGQCGVFDWDLAGGRIGASASMLKTLGLPAREEALSYGELASLTHPGERELLDVANEVLFEGGDHLDHRFRLRQVNGTYVHMHVRAVLVRDRPERPHFVGVVFDMSEQEAVKQQSRDAGLRLGDAVESLSEAFVLWDAQHRLVMCNSKYRQLYGLTERQTQPGTAYHELQKDSTAPRASNPLPADRHSDDTAQTFEAQLEDGRWLQISERRTRDGGFVSVGTDVTQFKRTQARMKESELRLNSTIDDLKVSQNTLELQAQQLVELAEKSQRQKNSAEAGSRAKSQFLANISHELRTPLNAIIGFSDIMVSRTFGPIGNEKYGEYANDIHESGNFLLGVINDVLDMSKIEAGRMTLNREPVDVAAVLEETLRIVRGDAEKDNIALDLEVPKGLQLDADRRAVKQILINLLSNAVKFTRTDGRVVVAVDEADGIAKLSIRDNGIGIAKDSIERLGQPFEQVQDQFTKDHKGSGLGLAIARSLTKMHGGDLTISSEVGVGTTVTVTLPCHDTLTQASAEAMLEEEAA